MYIYTLLYRLLYMYAKYRPMPYTFTYGGICMCVGPIHSCLIDTCNKLCYNNASLLCSLKNVLRYNGMRCKMQCARARACSCVWMCIQVGLGVCVRVCVWNIISTSFSYPLQIKASCDWWVSSFALSSTMRTIADDTMMVKWRWWWLWWMIMETIMMNLESF